MAFSVAVPLTRLPGHAGVESFHVNDKAFVGPWVDGLKAAFTRDSPCGDEARYGGTV